MIDSETYTDSSAQVRDCYLGTRLGGRRISSSTNTGQEDRPEWQFDWAWKCNVCRDSCREESEEEERSQCRAHLEGRDWRQGGEGSQERNGKKSKSLGRSSLGTFPGTQNLCCPQSGIHQRVDKFTFSRGLRGAGSTRHPVLRVDLSPLSVQLEKSGCFTCASDPAGRTHQLLGGRGPAKLQQS